jgi:hypothetical protein
VSSAPDPLGARVGFDFWLPDGSLGGFWWLGDPAGYVAGLVGRGRPYVLVKDLDCRPRGYELRAEGLWADCNDEAPDGTHWSWGLEAFGVAFDDAEEALRSEWGDRMALGFDLEWEAPDRLDLAPDRPGAVHGEILVGPSERIAFDGLGTIFRAECRIRHRARSDGRGLAAPVRLQGGRVLRQYLTADGWVRAWDESGAGTA